MASVYQYWCMPAKTLREKLICTLLSNWFIFYSTFFSDLTGLSKDSEYLDCDAQNCTTSIRNGYMLFSGNCEMCYSKHPKIRTLFFGSLAKKISCLMG